MVKKLVWVNGNVKNTAEALLKICEGAGSFTDLDQQISSTDIKIQK